MKTIENIKKIPTNSIWMFNADFSTFYSNRYDFVRFSNLNEIEFLSGSGALLDKDVFEFDELGNYSLKNRENFRFIEMLYENEVNLVFEGRQIVGNEDKGIQEFRFNLTKLIDTEVLVSNEELQSILSLSEWELVAPKRKRRKTTKFSEWRKLDKVETTKKHDKYGRPEALHHLTVFENSIIAVQESNSVVTSKAMVAKITNEEMVLINHFNNNEEMKLVRICN